MNEIIIQEELNIENMIYEVRGVQVMLSSDVAKLYNVETKELNQTIKRNINRFPESFCFQLNNKEIDELSLRSQFVTLNKQEKTQDQQSSRSQFVTLNKSNNLRGYNIKYAPYVLTEQGIMMLSGLLKSDIAVKVNVKIIDAFVKMRHYFSDSNKILINHENRLLSLENTLDKFKEHELSRLYFQGELYDAYSLLLDILNKAKEEIIIIDNYAGKELLDILSKTNKRITIVSSEIENILKKSYISQYNNVKFINNNTFHDRFIILDKHILYICGSSFKDLGKKSFYIGEIKDEEYLERILNIINST